MVHSNMANLRLQSDRSRRAFILIRGAARLGHSGQNTDARAIYLLYTSPRIISPVLDVRTADGTTAAGTRPHVSHFQGFRVHL